MAVDDSRSAGGTRSAEIPGKQSHVEPETEEAQAQGDQDREPELALLVHNAELRALVRDEYTATAQIDAIRSLLDARGALRFPRVRGRGFFQAAGVGSSAAASACGAEKDAGADADAQDGRDYTGYANVWVRDSAHVANALADDGRAALAARTVRDLSRFWLAHRSRWTDCISGLADFNADVMRRPHVRFDGARMREISEQRWEHAQNDAVGYFTWLACKLARAEHLDLLAPLAAAEEHEDEDEGEDEGEGGAEPAAKENAEDAVAAEAGHSDLKDTLVDQLVLITLFEHAVQYWRDADSGHWEEARKVEASSIGAMAAGFRDLAALLEHRPELADAFARRYVAVRDECAAAAGGAAVLELEKNPVALGADAVAVVRALRDQGLRALSEILPYECRDAGAERATDAALLFLASPLGIVDEGMARRIVGDVERSLAGAHGIRRYAGDSYWCDDYLAKVARAAATGNFGACMAARDALLARGREAQWCIFDSAASVVYGDLARAARLRGAPAGDVARLVARQTRLFNRAVGQVTGAGASAGAFPAFRCPESYYVRGGEYVANDICPLLWTQANLIRAMRGMKESIAASIQCADTDTAATATSE